MKAFIVQDYWNETVKEKNSQQYVLTRTFLFYPDYLELIFWCNNQSFFQFTNCFHYKQIKENLQKANFLKIMTYCAVDKESAQNNDAEQNWARSLNNLEVAIFVGEENNNREAANDDTLENQQDSP